MSYFWRKNGLQTAQVTQLGPEGTNVYDKHQ